MSKTIFSTVVILLISISSSFAQESDAIQKKFQDTEQLRVLQQKQPTAIVPSNQETEQVKEQPKNQKNEPANPSTSHDNTTKGQTPPQDNNTKGQTP